MALARRSFVRNLLAIPRFTCRDQTCSRFVVLPVLGSSINRTCKSATVFPYRGLKLGSCQRLAAILTSLLHGRMICYLDILTFLFQLPGESPIVRHIVSAPVGITWPVLILFQNRRYPACCYALVPELNRACLLTCIIIHLCRPPHTSENVA